MHYGRNWHFNLVFPDFSEIYFLLKLWNFYIILIVNRLNLSSLFNPILQFILDDRAD